MAADIEPWNSLEVAKLAASLLTPLVVAAAGYWLNRRLKQVDHANESRARQDTEQKEEESRRYGEERERARHELERTYEPHIQFRIGCNVFGPRNGSFVVEFVISAHNLSVVRQDFSEINLRVRGIPHEADLELRGDKRLAFPQKLLDDNIIPDGWEYVFVEPGVNQEITFITTIDSKYRYILARAEFRYDAHTPHSTERMFDLSPTAVHVEVE